MNVGEAPSNWLSKIIERVRRSINRPRPHREHVLERDAILAAIQKHPNGAALIGYAKLPGAILSALAVADRVEQDKKRDSNLMTAAPEIQASWHVFESLGLELPEPDFT